MIRKFYGSCEHGQVHAYEVELPLTVEILDAEEDEDLPADLVLWLKGAPNHYVSVVAFMGPCAEQAELVKAAFESLLATEEGQNKAIDFIKHDLQLQDVE